MVVHRNGKSHSNADALSRRPSEDLETSHIAAIDITEPFVEKLKGMRKKQLEDSSIGPVLRARDAKEFPGKDEQKAYSIETRRLFQIWDQLEVKHGVLHRKFIGTGGGSSCLQLVVPTSLRSSILSELHDGVTGGHLGQDKTLLKLKECYYWPGHWNDVQDWCNTCAACIARKSAVPKPRAGLQSIQAGYPLQLVAIDILGPLPESKTGNSYILVAGDYFTRWMEAYPIPNQEAITVANKLVDEMFCRFSPPEQLHSDQGRQFESQVVREICKLLKIEKTRTTPYHPQSDGLVERFNRTLLNMLATCSRDQASEWEKHVKNVCFACSVVISHVTMIVVSRVIDSVLVWTILRVCD